MSASPLTADIKLAMSDSDQFTTGVGRQADVVDMVAAVVNGASELMVEVFGPEIGAHARTVAGVTVMPFDVAIEIEADFLIE